jgi:hypothetical protein
MSVALEEWRGPSREALDEIEMIYRSVEGAGERILTRQVDYAYVALILAHFQRYCRGVHTEATAALVDAIPDLKLGVVLEDLLTEGRLLDRGNPTPGNLGRDFARFGFKLWEAIEADDRRNGSHKRELDRLCVWRNGIVHGDISDKQASGKLVPPGLDLDTCRDWRRAVGILASSIDRVVAKQCQNLGCSRPW